MPAMRTQALILVSTLLLPTASLAETVGLLPLPGDHGDPAATAVALQLLQQALRRSTPGLVVASGSKEHLARCKEDATVCHSKASVALGASRVFSVGVMGRQGDYELVLQEYKDGRLASERVGLMISTDGLSVVLRVLTERYLRTGRVSVEGMGDLLVWPSPSGAEIYLGGAAVARGATLLGSLPEGPLEIELRARHHMANRRELELSSGKVLELRVLLEPGMAGLPMPERPTLYGLAGTGALALAGTVFGLLSLSAQAEFDDTEPREDTMGRLLDTRDRGERYASLANASFLAAAAALAAIGVLYGLDWLKARQEVEAFAQEHGSSPGVARSGQADAKAGPAEGAPAADDDEEAAEKASPQPPDHAPEPHPADTAPSREEDPSKESQQPADEPPKKKPEPEPEPEPEPSAQEASGDAGAAPPGPAGGEVR